MDKEQQFRTKIREYFPQQDNALEEALSQLIDYEYPDEVVALVFIVSPERFTTGFPAHVFFMDDEFNEFFVYEDGEEEYPSPVEPGLLEIPYLYPKELESEFSAGEGVDLHVVAANEFIAWFAERWQAAGGDAFEKKAIIMAHNGNKVFSLNANKWLEEK